MELRRLGPDDRSLLRSVRLRALAEAPSAFGSSLAREEVFSDADWDARLATPGAVTFVAVDARGAPVGMVTGVSEEGASGVGDLVGLWVDPSARRSGVGDALVARVLAWAADGDLFVVRLCVTEGNETAERLYRRHGLCRTGRVEVRDRDGCVEIAMECPVGADPRETG